jgi:Domain of unknown function (DUF3806)
MPFWSRRKGRDQPEQRVEPLNDAELTWIAENVAAAREAIHAGGFGQEDEFSATSLDELWPNLRSEPADDPNLAINIVGLALGQLLVDRFGLSWAAVTDEHGTEIAVRGPSDFIVFPTNFVAKRYESGETGFIEPFVAEVARTLERLR